MRATPSPGCTRSRYTAPDGRVAPTRSVTACRTRTEKGKGMLRLVAVLTLLLSGAATAADLTIGARFEPTVDPHFFYVSTNIAYARHVFDPLVDRDETVQKRP